jgi:lysophospholipase L1-like esterase
MLRPHRPGLGTILSHVMLGAGVGTCSERWVGSVRGVGCGMRRWISALAVVAVWAVAGPGVGTAAAAPLPSRMAGIGDSITQAFDVCCWYGNHPANSWSTGGASSDGISSHYERIRSGNPSVVANNDAVSGARMGDAPAQAAKAVSQGAQYVTILMGANDLCTSSTSTMTSVDTFRSQFRQTLATLNSTATRPMIFVASIPNVYHLYQLFRFDLTARTVWATAGICQSLLSLSNTSTQRAAVAARNVEFNTVLAQECAAYPTCKFDGNAVYNFAFSSSQVSHLDYFHSSLSGQAALASVTWGASWWAA